MEIGDFLPILIMLFIVAVAFLFAMRRWKLFGKSVSKPGNKMVIGYAVVLLIGFIVFLFNDDSVASHVDFEKIPSLYHGMTNRELPLKAKDYMAEKWEYGFNQKTIHVKRDITPREHDDENTDYDDDWDDDEVNVNEVPVSFGYTDSNKIIVTYYKTPAVFSQGLDITNSIQDPKVVMKNNQLVISMPHLEEGLEQSAYKQEFPMLQFTKGKSTTYWMEHDHNTFFHSSEQRIYIQIPNGIQIDADDDFWME